MHISSRCGGITASVTLAIDSVAKALQGQGKDVIGFGAGEPDFDTPAPIRDACKAALDAGKTRYAPVAGLPELRQAICDKLLRDNGLAYQPSQIVVSCGAKHSLYNTFFALLDEGDEVLIPTPCWVSYPEQVRMVGGIPAFVRADAENDFKPTIAQWRAALTPRTRALILNSPNNPNGCVWTREELADIAQVAIEHDLVIVSDEIYEHLIYDGNRHISIASLGEDVKARTVVVNGVSKSFAMTGWRIGYTACAQELAAAMSGFQSHATSAPATMTQAAAVAALNGPTASVFAMRDEFDARRKALCARINQVPGLSCRVPGGAFYVMMNIRGALGKSYKGEKIACPMDFARLLLEGELVAVVPGEAFMADTYCRLSYATGMDNIQRGMDRIASFMAQLH